MAVEDTISTVAGKAVLYAVFGIAIFACVVLCIAIIICQCCNGVAWCQRCCDRCRRAVDAEQRWERRVMLDRLPEDIPDDDEDGGKKGKKRKKKKKMQKKKTPDERNRKAVPLTLNPTPVVMADVVDDEF